MDASNCLFCASKDTEKDEDVMNECSSRAKTTDECRDKLRRLEHAALEGVLHAFRAQGPLDVYKEVLLDHLKTALFISREDYIFKVDHVAISKDLAQVCNKLNPTYAGLHANWLLERQSVLPNDYRSHTDRLGQDVTDILDRDSITDETWEQMYKDSEAKEKKSLAKLLVLEKAPYAPEKRQIPSDSALSKTSTLASNSPVPTRSPRPESTASSKKPRAPEISTKSDATLSSRESIQFEEGSASRSLTPDIDSFAPRSTSSSQMSRRLESNSRSVSKATTSSTKKTRARKDTSQSESTGPPAKKKRASKSNTVLSASELAELLSSTPTVGFKIRDEILEKAKNWSRNPSEP